jgi:hypothetical protein
LAFALDCVNTFYVPHRQSKGVKYFLARLVYLLATVAVIAGFTPTRK